MTCLTDGPIPSSAATGIPGRPATSSSPMCGAHAAPMKASSGTPWSGARQTAAPQPGTARSTTRPAQRLPASPAFPTQDLRRRPDVKRSTAPLGAKWGAAVSRHSAIQSPLDCSDNRHLPGIQLLWPTLADRQDLVRIEGVRSSNPLSSTRKQQVSDNVRAVAALHGSHRGQGQAQVAALGAGRGSADRPGVPLDAVQMAASGSCRVFPPTARRYCSLRRRTYA